MRIKYDTPTEEQFAEALAKADKRIAELEHKLQVRSTVADVYFEIGVAAMGFEAFNAEAKRRLKVIDDATLSVATK